MRNLMFVLTMSLYKMIENVIVKNIEKKTENKFNEFIYGKSN